MFGRRGARASGTLATVLLVVLSLGVDNVSAGSGLDPASQAVARQIVSPPGPPPADKHDKMDSSLVAAARVARTAGRGQALGEARQRQVAVVDDRVRVVIE